jgi:hypothetical protein
MVRGSLSWMNCTPAGDAVLLVFEFAVTNLVGGDEDEWPCHENSLTRIVVLAMRWRC